MSRYILVIEGNGYEAAALLEQAGVEVIELRRAGEKRCEHTDSEQATGLKSSTEETTQDSTVHTSPSCTSGGGGR